MSKQQTIFYTLTDEAPFYATHSLFPVIQRFTKSSGIDFILKDISLAGRILANFPEYLPEDQQVNDELKFLGSLTLQPEANIIKLPNISASMPQLLGAIKELQAQGFSVPDYPENPQNEEEKKIKNTYDKIKGSAVNPVLREGNSDRRASLAVKNYARKFPHSMGEWLPTSKTEVATMQSGDFKHNEQSYTLPKEQSIRIELHTTDGRIIPLKENLKLLEGEIIDATVMNHKALEEFLQKEIKDAQTKDILFSIHLKATMMKVSDPIIFGYAVKNYFAPVFKKYETIFSQIGINPNNGLGEILLKIENLPVEERENIQKDIRQCIEQQPIAMVNSDKGITNLNVPNDVIIDASIPAMLRTSGKMWNAEGKLQDTKIIIPDSSYAGVYDTVVRFCKKHGAFDPKTMGSVPNVGLMAQQAEEYGSHDKTFEIKEDGQVKVFTNEDNQEIFSHSVQKGDIWRMCQTKDAPVQDWVKLAVTRARLTQTPAVFWLDNTRAHDAELIKKVKTYITKYDLEGIDIQILSPEEACQLSLERIRQGKDTISVTGNVLRDYLTDLFPILELGTSAKMLSIVPLMNGGGLFETGAGGSAPKHVEQLLEENHLRWDSLGEFMALGASLEHLGHTFQNEKAFILSETLNQAIEKILELNQSPSRKVGEIDNRGSHFFLALHWAEALANQQKDLSLATEFLPVAKYLKDNQDKINTELISVQGEKVNVQGYYHPKEDLVSKTMRPSITFNEILK
ncbi:MAG: NADP-dependent isocitrate dehydrogenase [Capnocytophaga sp.]|nr:NADP-dependent isocitrate dehydrogenase [Capnocytophaga sp.]